MIGGKKVTLQLDAPLARVPEALGAYSLALSDDGHELNYTYETRGAAAGEGGHGIVDFLRHVSAAGVAYKDLRTRQSSLEDIFVSLVEEKQ